MDKQYFIASEKDHSGPFSLSELQGKKLNPDTLIWSKELTQWTKAAEIAELKTCVIPVPPPTPKQVEIQAKKEEKKVRQNITKKILKKVTIYTIVTYLVFFVVIYAVCGGFNSFERNPSYPTRIGNYYEMRLYISSVQQLRSVLASISLFWSFIFSAICAVLFFIRERVKYAK